MTNEELQAFVEEENESYGGERTMSAYIRGYLTGDEWRTAQRLNLGAETFSAEREVYVLTFSDPTDEEREIGGTSVFDLRRGSEIH